jgi:uncharacterized protein
VISACALAGVAWLAASRAGAADIPYLTGRVVDEANILTAEARTRLTRDLKAHEDATTNHVVVLTVPSIGSQSIEEYATKVFESWKPGQKGKDNGVLVVVVPQDRKMRIEVGYGLEGRLTDGTAGQIIRTWMTPAFKAGNYDKGVEDGVAAILARLEGRGEPSDRTPIAAPAASSGTRINSVALPWIMRTVFGLFAFGIIGLFTLVGILTPGVGWFMYLFLIPFWAVFPAVIIGPYPTMVLLAAYLIGYPIAKLRLKNSEWYKKAAADLKTKGSTTIGGFTVTGGSSSSSGWSSSGSSFSGGGGSSGGGGASGSW